MGVCSVADTELVVQKRDEKGKGSARRLRAGGFVPAVVYGPDKENRLLKVESGALKQLIHTAGTGKLVDLRIDGNGSEPQICTVLVKDMQQDPIKGEFLHVDFYQVPMDREISISVPVVLIGEEDRVADGGVLTQNLHELEVSCLPANIPERVEVDVSGLAIGDSIQVMEVEVGEGITITTDPNETVVSVVVPTQEVVEEEEEPGEELEPQIIGEEEDEETEAAEEEPGAE